MGCRARCWWSVTGARENSLFEACNPGRFVSRGDRDELGEAVRFSQTRCTKAGIKARVGTATRLHVSPINPGRFTFDRSSGLSGGFTHGISRERMVTAILPPGLVPRTISASIRSALPPSITVQESATSLQLSFLVGFPYADRLTRPQQMHRLNGSAVLYMRQDVD